MTPMTSALRELARVARLRPCLCGAAAGVACGVVDGVPPYVDGAHSVRMFAAIPPDERRVAMNKVANETAKIAAPPPITRRGSHDDRASSPAS